MQLHRARTPRGEILRFGSEDRHGSDKERARALGERVRLGRRVQALAHAAAPPRRIRLAFASTPSRSLALLLWRVRQRASPRSLGKAAADCCNSAPTRSVMPASTSPSHLSVPSPSYRFALLHSMLRDFTKVDERQAYEEARCAWLRGSCWQGNEGEASSECDLKAHLPLGLITSLR